MYIYVDMNSPPKYCVTQSFLFILDFLLTLQWLWMTSSKPRASAWHRLTTSLWEVLFQVRSSTSNCPVEVSTKLHRNSELKKCNTYLFNLHSPHMFYFPYPHFLNGNIATKLSKPGTRFYAVFLCLFLLSGLLISMLFLLSGLLPPNGH